MKCCKCRNCGRMYDPNKSRADFTGYCSAACMHEKSRSFGYKKSAGRIKDGVTEYDVLKKHNAVGNINQFGDACDYTGRPVETQRVKVLKSLQDMILEVNPPDNEGSCSMKMVTPSGNYINVFLDFDTYIVEVTEPGDNEGVNAVRIYTEFKPLNSEQWSPGLVE